MIIYKVTNKLNGKLYVGQTVQKLEHRWRDHIRGDNGKNTQSYLYRALQKHGKDNFTVEQIDTASTIEGLNVLEEFYIKKLNTLAPNGYNLLPGGENRRQHEDTKEKLSKINKGKIIPNRWTGGNTTTPTEDIKAKISASLKGRPIKNRMNGASKGRPVSAERRAMISATMTGQPQPWKYKAVIDSNGVEYESVNACAKILKANRVTISGLIKSGKVGRLGLTFKFKEPK
jgi:group I intron endonuclease